MSETESVLKELGPPRVAAEDIFPVTSGFNTEGWYRAPFYVLRGHNLITWMPWVSLDDAWSQAESVGANVILHAPQLGDLGAFLLMRYNPDGPDGRTGPTTMEITSFARLSSHRDPFVPVALEDWPADNVSSSDPAPGEPGAGVGEWGDEEWTEFQVLVDEFMGALAGGGPEDGDGTRDEDTTWLTKKVKWWLVGGVGGFVFVLLLIVVTARGRSSS